MIINYQWWFLDLCWTYDELIALGEGGFKTTDAVFVTIDENSFGPFHAPV